MELPALSPSRWMTFLCLLSAASANTDGQKIHEQMTRDELRNVFHIHEASSIPEYHLVRLTHHVSRRNIPSHHDSNSLRSRNSKVPHEKSHVVKNARREPSLLDDQMFKKLRDNTKDVDIIGDLNNTVQIHFGGDKPDVTVENKEEEVEAKNDPVSANSERNAESDRNSAVSDKDGSDSLSDQEHVDGDQDDDTHRIQLEAFGNVMSLSLKRQEGLVKKDGVKMWDMVTNVTQPHGVDLEETENNDDEDIGELYQDEEAGAALLIRRHPKKKNLIVEGSIGHDLVIRPLPDSMLASSAPDDEMFLEAANMDDMVSIDTGLPLLRRPRQQERLRKALSGAGHVIIRRRPTDGDHHSDYALMEPDHLAKRYRRKRSTEEAKTRRKRDAPYVIYPEILVIVDYDGYRLHGGDNVQIKRYFVSFWNGVDLRYKLLKGPRIRISIAGIIISRGRDATPYLERNRVGRDAIDSAAALTDMGKYLFRERRLPVYDIAVAITKLDMCRRQFANDACNRGTAGFAYVGGACVVNKRLEKVNSVAIIEDTGGFSGIIVAAHEVGHLLGAVHDGSPPPSYLGGPGAEKCRWEDGFIMSDLRHTEKGFRWSPCSVQSFHHFLNGDTATCLYNAPHEDDSLPRVLPGRLLTLDAQCRKDRGTSACFKDERVCAQLFCFDAGSGYCVAYRPAAEGSLCGDGQYCMNGRCIAEHENIIPDYSQHTPSYVRPETSPFYNNATSIEETTKPYTQKAISYQSYDTSKEYTYSTSSSTTVNPYNYFQYIQSTTKNPYDFNHITEKSTPVSSSVTPHQFIYNKYSITSTKSPYDFQDFVTRRALKTTEKTTTTTFDSYKINPYEKYVSSEDPYALNRNPDLPYQQPAAKNAFDTNGQYENPIPYQSPNPYEQPKSIEQSEKTTAKPRSGFFSKFDLEGFFNKPSTRSPFAFKENVKSLYKIGTYYTQQRDNAIRPDASQQISIEPANLVYSFHANVTNEDGNYSIDCSTPEAHNRPECITQTAVATSK